MNRWMFEEVPVSRWLILLVVTVLLRATWWDTYWFNRFTLAITVILLIWGMIEALRRRG